MTDFFGSVWWLFVALGVLVTFHEFGHFWVARRAGVKVLRFSIGFGPALWSHRARDGVEYVLAALPLGGYVKMLDEREGDVDPRDLAGAFNRKSAWTRIAIVAAGPVANLVLCVLLLWAMFVIGRPDYLPVAGTVEGLAQQAGIRPGDTLLSIDGRATPTWTEAAYALLPAALDRKNVPVRIRSPNGAESTRTLQLARLPPEFDERQAIALAGIMPRHFLATTHVGDVAARSPAANVLQSGDRIVRVDGTPVTSFEAIAPLVQRAASRDGGVGVAFEREGQLRNARVVPTRSDDAGPARWILGIGPSRKEAAPDALLRYGPIEAVPRAMTEAVYQARQLFAMVGRAFTGAVSLRNTVGGPVTIGKAANEFAGRGVAWFLSLLAMLSLSLGILNLLPVPILDGGHLLYYLIELVKGSPVSERVMAAGQMVGLALIAGLMGLAFYNDIVNHLLR